MSVNVATLRRPTLGRATSSERFATGTLSRVTYPAGARFPDHAHDRTYLCLVLAGGFREQVGSETRIAEPGSVVVMPAGHRHSDAIADEGARSLVLTLEAEETEAGPFARWHIEHGGLLARTMLWLLRAARAGALEELMLDEHVRKTADVVARLEEVPMRSRPSVVGRAIEYLEAHRDVKLRLSDVAKAVGVDRAYLARAFRRSVGRTMGQYRRASRVRCAARLVAGGTPLVETAAASGFADQSHLTRAFRDELGVTPGEYRALSHG
ncbi:MAG TPA: AraC family transcriptional regulator [Candidatus Eisenbacteria bacterium]|nr:AraC family transcriptional regulator [Candidatus Eisenbacteria bacterium]